ncbi:ABC-type Fe3+ transport system, permease component [Halobacteroides halobius DSM 5150]|uniref:ABC-type Fe3+ transport system, permease component n=1 Tax=Halobacteroides halobius (strain ATCC 35273 / DSM 5150 / MD-1) TaxID=748449 RepID=L0K6A0_HALHC|nr:iron ABC transporter permease [Halobacteroides halobius]AGB40777.1 ABC-type Fe3+ transport system, permease component [Halobacteroides halobius DSM 5150]
MLKKRDIKSLFNIWSVLSFIIVLLVLIPNLNILLNIFKPVNENWQHIKEYLLKDYIISSTILVLFTGVFSIFMGLIPAWFVTQYNFPGRDFFNWGLILPLAIPPYIGAYTYTGLLNYTGVIQTFLRDNGIELNQAYFDIMTIEGAIFIYTIFLFPYVYILTRSFLAKQSASLIESARTLGRSPFEIFWHVVLPISRGAIVAGVSLVILEVLNDYGVVKYFGISTFSTAIFRTWFAMGDLNSAVKLSALLMLFVFTVLLIEKFSRGGRRFSYSTTKVRPVSRQKLSGVKAYLISGFCSLIFSIGFLVPTLQLLHWSWLSYAEILDLEFIVFTLNSLSVALFSSALIIVLAVIIANTARINDNILSKLYAKIALLGYSIPGAVIAVGILLFFIILDNALNTVLRSSIIMLIFAYVIRFLGIGYNSVESGFDKVGDSFFEASRTLGRGITETFFKVDFPMIKPAVISGFLLVLIEVLKELPLTLILRPFNFDTLASKAFEYAGNEMIHEAALSSIIIILICGIAIYYIHKLGGKEDKDVR